MSYQGPLTNGSGEIPAVPAGGSLDTGLGKQKAKHRQRNVKVVNDKVPSIVGSQTDHPVHDNQQPRKLSDRGITPSHHLDSLGLQDGLNDSLGDDDIEALLNEQLNKNNSPGSKPDVPDPDDIQLPVLPTDDGNPPSSPPFDPSKTGHQPNVQISSTTTAEAQRNIDGIKKGLKNRLGFLDKVPHKKNLLFIAIGTALCAASLAAMPATLGLMGLGSALVLTGTAYMLHDSGTSGNEEPQPTTPEKKKDEHDEKKKTDEPEPPSSTPEPPDEGFLAVANPDFQEAEQGTSAAEARENMKALLQQKPPYQSKQLDELVTSLTSGSLPLSHAVAEITGELLHKAGMNHNNQQAWTHLDEMVNAVEGGLTDEGSGEENAKKMREACRGVLDSVTNLTSQVLLEARGQMQSLISSDDLPGAACKKVIASSVEAIDEKLSEMKGMASTSQNLSAPASALSEGVPAAKLGLDPGMLGMETSQARLYLAFRMELAEKINRKEISLSEHEADRVLFAAMNVLIANPSANLSGPAFIQQLKKDSAVVNYAEQIDKVAKNPFLSRATTS